MQSRIKRAGSLRFSRLKLNGFKSFVDPTDLVIADGLTGVVGPNGCGKSNLLEALRWAMGENRPTSMRGSGMEDVIFAGAATRPARNFAEVSIHIDNEDRLAPAGFNESDQLEIVRRITRDAGSAFKVNTKDARARDVQMLFADASTGAHSPALVRQGQIAELINAKPRARRRILEEAAGISGLYQRRHEAELKLNGAEQNLLRVDDVIEQLAAQLAQLAKQARQAKRYRAIGDELRKAEGMLLYRRWREADAARAEASGALREASTATGEAERAALAAGNAREEAENAVPPMREEEAVAAAILQRVLVERDRLADEEKRAQQSIDTLVARINQLGRDLEREAALNHDAGETISRLRDEEADLRDAGEGFEESLARAETEAREAATTLQEQEANHSRLTEDTARLTALHQSAQRRMQDSQKTLERSEAGAADAKSSLQTARTTQSAAKAALESSQQQHEQAAKAAEDAEAALAKADQDRADAQAKEADARAGRSEAEGEVTALNAEVTALARLVERDTAEGGQVLDDLRVSTGYEKALGAALSDDLRAPAVSREARSGWAPLPAYSKPQALPEGIKSLSNYVSVPEVLARRIGQVGLVDPVDGARLQSELLPGQRLVSIEGDLWRWDGFRAGAEDAPSAAALRLQQLNRLEELKQELVSATARADGATQAHDVLKAELIDLTDIDTKAREDRRNADTAMADASRALSKAEADSNIGAGRVESLGLAVKRHEDEATEARSAAREAEAALADLGDVDAARATVEEAKMGVEAARIAMMSRRASLDELRHAGEAREKRMRAVLAELETWQTRLENADARMNELSDRREGSEAELQVAQKAPERIATNREALAGKITDAEKRRSKAADDLSVAEMTLRTAVADERDAERRAGEAREARAVAEARSDAALEAVQTATARIAEAEEGSPEALLTRLEVEPARMPSAERIENDVNRLKRQREALGAVNLRAEEDAREVQEEHDVLVNEKSDLEEAIRKLRSGINTLNREGRERLLTAFEQVNSNFTLLFRHLFGGGEANLVLVESDDPLEAGLEIMCQPPGKKLSTLSLLSGGEQTLTALALIFAVFLANPAPICVLDEVDAPLDDANVNRFCDLLDEMTRRTDTRFLIITHHAVTMSRMDRLFGVTMAEQGVSQLVSVDLKKAEQLVA